MDKVKLIKGSDLPIVDNINEATFLAYQPTANGLESRRVDFSKMIPLFSVSQEKGDNPTLAPSLALYTSDFENITSKGMKPVLSGQKTEKFTSRELDILKCIKDIHFESLEAYKNHDFALYAFGSTYRNGTKACVFWVKDLSSSEFGDYIFQIDIPYNNLVPTGIQSSSVITNTYRMDVSVDFSMIEKLFGNETWIVWTTEKGGNIRFIPTIVDKISSYAYASDLKELSSSVSEINTIGFKQLDVALTGNGYIHYPTGEIRTTQTPYKYSEPINIEPGVQYGIRCMAGGVVSVLSYLDDKNKFISGQKTSFPDNVIGEIHANSPIGAKKIVFCGVEGTITALTSIPIVELP